MAEDRPTVPTPDSLMNNFATRTRTSRGKLPPCRVTVPLDADRTVTVKAASGLDLEGYIRALEDALAQARKARSLRVTLATYAQMVADQARSG